MKQELLNESLEQFPLRIDELPEGWSVAVVTDVAHDIAPGFASGKHDSEGNGHPHMRPMNIDRNGRVDLTVVKSVPSTEGRTLSQGDVLFNNTNSPDLVGKTALIGEREAGFAFSNHMTRVRVDESVSPGYVAHYLQFLWASGYMKHRCTSHVNQASISSKTLARTVPLLVPPSNEQVRIVEKLEELLSDLDAGVAELKAAQRKLAQYRQSLLKAAVEGTLTADWRETHGKPQESGAELLQRILKKRREHWESNQLAKYAEQRVAPPKGWQIRYPKPSEVSPASLGGFPDSWCLCDLETIIPPDKTGTRTGPFGSLLKKHEHQSAGIPVIGIENIERMTFVPGSKIHVTAAKAEELCEYDLQPGDVVISRSGTVGEICAIPEGLGDARFSTNIMRVRLSKQWMLPEFFCLIFNGSPSVLEQVRTLCAGSTRDFLNTEILMSLTFPLPPMAEQAEIVDRLRALLATAEEQERSILLGLKQCAAQRRNILKAAFAGQLVPQDPSDEPASELLARIRAERASNGGDAPRRRRKTA